MLSTAPSQIENTVQKKNVLNDSKTGPHDYMETLIRSINVLG